MPREWISRTYGIQHFLEHCGSGIMVTTSVREGVCTVIVCRPTPNGKGKYQTLAEWQVEVSNG
jgi:hypothetical protein